MSETGNPLMYADANDGVAIRDDGTTVTMDQLRELHYSEKDPRGWSTAPDPDATYLTFLLEKDSDRENGVYLTSTDRFVRVKNLPLAIDGFTAYNRGAAMGCAAGEMDWYNDGGSWDEHQCDRPVRTLVNGWSAGPTPFCSRHLARLTRELGRGLMWRPVRLRYEDIYWLNRHDLIHGS
jgi:hypothetical protein